MIGIIEKVMVDCLLEAGDEELVQDVFLKAGIPLNRVYRLDQHYPDSETARLIDAILSVTGMTPQELFDLFSRVFFEVVEVVFPEFLRMSTSSEDLVRRQVKIHALIAAGSRNDTESRKSMDKFQMEDRGAHHIAVRYKSELQLNGLYETLVRYAAGMYGDRVEITTDPNLTSETGACTFEVRWTEIAGRPTHFHSAPARPEDRRSVHG